MDFRNFFDYIRFRGQRIHFSYFTELPCLDDFENPGQLPVSQVLEGTAVWVLWIFVIFSLPTFSGSRNPFFIVPRSHPVWMTLKSQVNFRFYRYSKVLRTRFHQFPQISCNFPRFRGHKINFLQITKLPCFEVNLNHLNSSFRLFNYSRETKKNGFLDLENVGNEEISKIYKTQSSVPSRTYKTGS